MNLDLCKKVDLITKGINEKDETPNAHGKKQHESLKQKVNSSGIQNPVSSSSLPRSAGLHNEFSLLMMSLMGRSLETVSQLSEMNSFHLPVIL